MFWITRNNSNDQWSGIRIFCLLWYHGDFKMITKEKVRNQVKSRFYYLFWGIATFSVVAGQVYVGAGYRAYAGALLRIFDAVEIEVGRDYGNERFY